METRSLTARPETFINSTASKNTQQIDEKTKQAETTKDPINLTTENTETLSLSNGSLKLAAINNTEKLESRPPIQDELQAKQTLEQLKVNLQNNPNQALNAQSDILPNMVKALLA